MSALTIVRQLLLTDAAVTAIAGVHIHLTAAPAGTPRPHIVMHRTSNVDHPTLAGAGKYWLTRVQLDCIGNTPSEPEELADAVIERLNGIIKMRIAGCRDVDILGPKVDFTEEYGDTSENYRRVLGFDVWWRRNA